MDNVGISWAYDNHHQNNLQVPLCKSDQVCRELWEFSGDGERYNEKIVHSFLPALFTKWREAGTNHTVTIVLISRVYYDEHEIDYAAGPLLTEWCYSQRRKYNDCIPAIQGSIERELLRQKDRDYHWEDRIEVGLPYPAVH